MNCALWIVHYELCIMNSKLWRHPLSIQAVGNCHPGLDPGTRRIHPQIANVAAYNWFPCQARDDVMCERLNWEEDVFIIHCSLFIIHYALCIVHYALLIMHCALCIMHCALCIMHCALCIVHYALCIMHCALWIVHYIMYAHACVCEGCWTIWTHFTVKTGALRWKTGALRS